MDYGWLNIGSLVFGIIALALPFFRIIINKDKKIVLFIFISFTLCCISILFQTIYTDHLVYIKDYSAIEDTHYAVLLAEKVLIVLTVVLNFIMMLKYRKKEI